MIGDGTSDESVDRRSLDTAGSRLGGVLSRGRTGAIKSFKKNVVELAVDIK